MIKAKNPNDFPTWCQLPLSASIGMAGVWSLIFLYFRVPFVNQIHYWVGYLPIPPEIYAITLIPGALLLPAAAYFSQNFLPTLRLLNKTLFPLLIPIPVLLLFPDSYFSLLLPILASGIAFYRLGTALSPDNRRTNLLPRYGTILAILGFAAAVWYHYQIQCSAYGKFYLFFSDWGEYSENYLRLAFGEKRCWTDFLAVAGHWNPLPNIIMTLLYRLHPQANSCFAINALLIGSAVPLSYLLARAARLPVGISLIFGLIAFLNPVLNGQSLSLFYGYHPVNFQIPILLGFFICRAKQKKIFMAILFLLSLLIQETAAFLWAGYALYLLMEKQFLKGTALFGGCIIFFGVISSVVMPHLAGSTHYAQMFHYTALGNTPLEVLCSPILRPAAFWGTIFEYQNFAFISSLLLPLALPVLIKPKLAIAALPLLTGVCLQSSPDLKNIVMQYGLEISLILLAATILNAADKKCLQNSKLLIFLGSGIRRNRHTLFRLRGLWLGTLTLSIGCYCIIGRYAINQMSLRPNIGNALEELRQITPRESRVIATTRQRAHFVFSHSTAGLNATPQTGDTIILALSDAFTGTAELERFRAKIAANPAAAPLGSLSCGGEYLVIYRVLPPETSIEPLPFLQPITDEEFAKRGWRLNQDNPDFEARMEFRPGEIPQLLVKLKRPVDYDVNLEIASTAEGSGTKRIIPFANGLIPAYAAKASEVFIMPLPEADSGSMEIRILRRRDSGPISPVP